MTATTDNLHAWEQALAHWVERRTVTAPQAKAAIAAFQPMLSRDVILISLIPGYEDCACEAAATEDGEGLGPATRALFVGDAEPSGNTGAALDLIRHLVRLAPGKHVPQVASIGAVLAWWMGEQEALAACISASIYANRHHHLTHLVSTAAYYGMRPAWQARLDPVTNG